MSSRDERREWNAKIIAEFRANEGRVGGNFEGAPMVILHHRGRKSGSDYETPVMCLPDATDEGTVYVFASNAGGPTHPDWYYNLTDAGAGTIERGTETYAVTVTEVTGEDRDRIYGEQAQRYPNFATYEEKVAGIRVIPVLALQRS